MSESDNISAPQGPAQLRLNIPALDEGLYDLTDEERSFFKQQTGIQDDDELKAHILQVQAEAYKVCDREPDENSCYNLIPGLPKTGFSLPLHPQVPFRKVSTRKRDAETVFEMGHSPRLKMCRLSPYQDLLRTGKSRKEAIFLDIGSCGEKLRIVATRPSLRQKMLKYS